MRSTSPWHPADSQQTVSMGVRPSKISQPPACHLTADSWANPVEIRQCWATSTELPSGSVDSWAVLKAYCLKSLGFEVACHGATARCYSPYILVLLYLSCYSDAQHSLLLNKPLCKILHSFANVKPLPGLPPPPSGILLHPADFSSSLDTHLRPHLCQAAFPELPLSPPLPTSCWVPLLHAADSPYLYVCHSTHPRLKSSVYSAYYSCCTVNSVKIEILSFVCYPNK